MSEKKYEVFNISKGIVISSFNEIDEAIKFAYYESLKLGSDDFYYINKINELAYHIEYLVYGGSFFKEHHFNQGNLSKELL